MVQVVFTKDYKVVESFVFNALNHALTMCIQVGTLVRSFDHLQTIGLEDVIELFGELGVTIMDQM